MLYAVWQETPTKPKTPYKKLFFCNQLLPAFDFNIIQKKSPQN
jgi:hypothetical protein